MQNLKLDIIYYLTSTDFEMEFNLGGCCPMRLFTDRSSDIKSYVVSLSRAVSRSKIIISAGPLFGEQGLITLTAKAISRGVTHINGSDYGIDNAEEIGVIEGSIPLVTSDGVFGGCIIESGPQTIIVLTENREIRKNILTFLIHPYVKETSIAQMTKDTSALENETEQPTEELPEELPTEEMPTDEMPLEELTPEEELPIGELGAEEQPVEEENKEPEPQEEKEISKKGGKKEKENYTPFVFEEPDELPPTETEMYTGDGSVLGLEEMFMPAEVPASDIHQKVKGEYEEQKPEEPEEKPKKSQKPAKKHKGLSISIIIIAVLLLIVLGALAYIAFYIPYTNGMGTMEYLKEIMELKAVNTFFR